MCNAITIALMIILLILAAATAVITVFIVGLIFLQEVKNGKK